MPQGGSQAIMLQIVIAVDEALCRKGTLDGVFTSVNRTTLQMELPARCALHAAPAPGKAVSVRASSLLADDAARARSAWHSNSRGVLDCETHFRVCGRIERVELEGDGHCGVRARLRLRVQVHCPVRADLELVHGACTNKECLCLRPPKYSST